MEPDDEVFDDGTDRPAVPSSLPMVFRVSLVDDEPSQSVSASSSVYSGGGEDAGSEALVEFMIRRRSKLVEDDSTFFLAIIYQRPLAMTSRDLKTNKGPGLTQNPRNVSFILQQKNGLTRCRTSLTQL